MERIVLAGKALVATSTARLGSCATEFTPKVTSVLLRLKQQ
jgi:hypothetical protein